jgi:ABC-type multidrug transport system fused ATPase/permease subunit
MATATRHLSSSSEGKTQKAKINKENLRQALALFKYLKPHRGKFILGLVFIALSAFTTSLFPLFLGKMIDAASPGASLPGMGGGSQFGLKNIHWSLNTTLLLIFAQLTVQTFFSFMRVYLLTAVGERSLADMRKDVYSKLLTMPMSFFTEKRVGELSNRISSDLSQIQDAISFTLAEFLRGIFTLIIGLFFIFWISPKLALVMLSVVPLLAIVAVVFGRRIRKMSRKTQDQLADSGTIVQETFQGISIVKAFTSEFYEISRYVKSLKAVVSTAISNARYRGAFVAFMIFSLFGTLAFVVWFGGRMIQQPGSGFTIGSLIMFVIFSMFVGGTFAGFADMFSQLQKTLGATQSVREILRTDGEPVDIKQVVIEPQHILKGNVRFEHVAFSYPSRKDIQVLKDLSLTACNGEQIAIVGPSGAGKSTIASLLLHFYEPDNGTLYFDERPAREFPLSQLRRQMAFVPQDVILFGGSIKENIAYGKPDASDEEIIAAAKNANAHEFVKRFPEQYETIVGERGIKLSGGQRQRIAIARAILKDPAILILDEATSSLDSESELLVQDALDNLMKGRTSFVIAHRLSTIRNADKIVLIDKGIVSEAGTHAELMNHNGLYRKLNDMQFDFGMVTQSPTNELTVSDPEGMQEPLQSKG